MNYLRKQLIQNIDLSNRANLGSLYIQKPGDTRNKRVTLLPGVGVGPELANSVQRIFQTINVPVKFDVINQFSWEDQDSLANLQKNPTILMGVIPPEKEIFRLVDNAKIYKELGLFAEVFMGKSIKTINSRHKNVDIVIIRETTEGEFSGIEHEVYPGVIESIKVTTQTASLRLAEYAFEFAHMSGRKKVSAVHKANIMKMVDGLFLEACREVAQKYPFIQYEEVIIDNCAMQLVRYPSQFDVMVMPNLFGSITSNTVAGIVGGIGLVSSAAVGFNHMLFTQGTRHVGFDIAGKNIVNPTGFILSSVMMLRYLGLPKFASSIAESLLQVLDDHKIETSDLGGKASTSEFVDEICRNLREEKVSKD